MTAPLPPLPEAVEKAMQTIDMQGPVCELRLAIRQAIADERNACLEHVYEAIRERDDAKKVTMLESVAFRIRARPVSHE